LRGHTTPVESVAFSPNGKLLASGGDKTARIWNATTGQLLLPPLEHNESVASVAFSPDGKWLATAEHFHSVRLWDTAGRLKTVKSRQGSNEVVSLVFSPDGSNLIAAEDGGHIALWRRMGGGAARELNLEDCHAEYCHPSALRSDGKVLAAGVKNTIHLWDITSQTAITAPLVGNTTNVSALAFSSDGKTLASGAFDGTIMLWDLETNRPLGNAFHGHTDYVEALTFSADGKFLASYARDGRLLLWDIDPAVWAVRACRVANRNLSLAEWKRYVGDLVPYHRTCPGLPDGEGVAEPAISTQQSAKAKPREATSN